MCRDVGIGVDFRRSMIHEFGEMEGGENFSCPKDKPWTGSLKKYEESSDVVATSYAEAETEIEALEDNSEHVAKIKKWLKKAQEDLKKVSECSSCAYNIHKRLLESWEITKRRMNNGSRS